MNNQTTNQTQWTPMQRRMFVLLQVVVGSCEENSLSLHRRGWEKEEPDNPQTAPAPLAL